MELPIVLRSIQDLIAKDDLDDAIKLLLKLCENSPLLSELLHQSGRLSELKKKIRIGTIDSETEFLVTNKIRIGLLNVLEEIKNYSTNEEVLKEVSEFERNNPKLIEISDSGASTVYGNVNISGEVVAGRDIQTGGKDIKGKKPFWKFW